MDADIDPVEIESDSGVPLALKDLLKRPAVDVLKEERGVGVARAGESYLIVCLQVLECGALDIACRMRPSFRQYSNDGMVVKSPEAVAALAALAHDNRLAVYRMLVEAGPEGLPAGVIAERLKVPSSSLTFHLQSLQRAGLITQVRMSRQLFYAADFGTMNGLVGFLTENCCGGAVTCAPACTPVRAGTKAVKRARKVA